MNTIIMMVGFLLIYIATDYKRPKENQFRFFSYDGFIQWCFIVGGVYLITSVME